MLKNLNEAKAIVIGSIITAGAAIIAAIITGIFLFQATASQQQILATNTALAQIITQSISTINAPTQTPIPTNTPQPTYTFQLTYTPRPTYTPIPLPSSTSTQAVVLPFSDDFNNGIRPEWSQVSGKWIMSGGEVVMSDIDSTVEYDPDIWSQGMIIVGDPSWTDYKVSVKIDEKDAWDNWGMIIVRAQNQQNYLAWKFYASPFGEYASWFIVKGSKWTEVPNTRYDKFEYSKPNFVQVVVQNDVIMSYINQKLVATWSGVPFQSGAVGLRTQSQESVKTVSFDDFTIEPAP